MHTRSSVFSTAFTEIETITLLLQYAVENQFSIAVWRLPNDPIRHLILSRKHGILKHDVTIEELSSGFIFSPFDKEKDTIFLPADYKFSFNESSLLPAENPHEQLSQTWLLEQFRKADVVAPKRNLYHLTPSSTADVALPYINLVKLSVAEIEKGQLEKVVPSRKKIIDLPLNFDVIDSFQQMCDTYPHAMISLISTPVTGTWLGATPETLVSVQNKSIFKTVALAGTKQYHEGTNLKQVAWTQKEIEEQALVERYIISCFKKIRVREYDEHGPKTVVAGNLMHLKSDFTVDMKAINFPQLGSVMLQLLHPTSAVCGMPLEPALEFLKLNEGYDREYYGGFLGPVNVRNNIDIFVNIRCMKLLQKQAIAYAGAGVTVDSDPDQELEETEMKFNTLLSVIQKGI